MRAAGASPSMCISACPQPAGLWRIACTVRNRGVRTAPGRLRRENRTVVQFAEFHSTDTKQARHLSFAHSSGALQRWRQLALLEVGMGCFPATSQPSYRLCRMRRAALVALSGLLPNSTVLASFFLDYTLSPDVVWCMLLSAEHAIWSRR